MAPTVTVRTTDGTAIPVDVDDARFIVEGTMYEVAEASPGMYRVSDGGRTRTAYVAGPPEACWVFLDGRTFQLEVVSDATPRRRTGTQDQGLAAPMPATVIRVLVAPGQAVKTGDVLLTLEAMKMELPIKSPRDGTVKTIRCEQGDLVQPGVPLLELA